MPDKPCPRALADARELARRLGTHRHRDVQAAVVLVGSKASGSHGPASDTDLIVVPAWQTWPGPHAERAADRTVARFQTGRRAPVQFHLNGTDIGVAESWQTAEFHQAALDTTHARCWIPCAERKFTEYDDDPGRVSLRRMPPPFPSPDPDTPNAVICADSADILAQALANIPAYATAPLRCQGTAIRIAASHIMGRSPQGSYGRWDFPHPGPLKEKRLPMAVISELAEPIPESPWELAQAAAARAEEAAEELAAMQGTHTKAQAALHLLHEVAASADAAADLLQEQPTDDSTWPITL